ncbi:hypothetical protein [Tritonibacter horizontis]|uniref:hypothetical protein n=1 Tax=Tritonibacter horizontis TaxID=1768241 RepID=UPI00104256C7|nr:hypothetical protein [Tritonibacter horizontis]
MALIAANDYEDLPNEPIARWLQLRDLLERRLLDSQDYESGLPVWAMLEYSHVLSVTAQAIRPETLSAISVGNALDEFDEFRAKAAALAAQLSFQPRKSGQADVLPVSSAVRGRLISEVDRLTDIVRQSELADHRKEKVFSLLKRLRSEVEAEKLDYNNTLKAISLCAAALVGTTSFLADAPHAIATIAQLIGLQEEAHQEKLQILALPSEPAVPKLPPPPQKRLPPPSVD